MNLAQAPKQGIQFVKEAREELRKVTWPGREQIIRYTGIVVVASIAIGFITGGIDYLLSFMLERLFI